MRPDGAEAASGPVCEVCVLCIIRFYKLRFKCVRPPAAMPHARAGSRDPNAQRQRSDMGPPAHPHENKVR